MHLPIFIEYMILKVDKSNASWGVILIPIFAVVICLPIFFSKETELTYYYEWQSQFFSVINRYIFANFILTASLLIFNAFTINRVFSRTNLFSKATFVPALLYMVFITFINPLQANPILLIHLLLIGLIDQLMQIDKGEPAIHISFKSALIIGMISCFSFYHVLTSIIVFITLYTIKSFNWREWFLVVLGVLVPLLYLFIGGYFFNDKIDVGTLSGSYLIEEQIQLRHYIQIGCAMLILLISLRSLIRFYSHNTIMSKKRLFVLLILFVVTLGYFFIGYYFFSQIDYTFAVPLIFLLSASIKSNEKDSLVSLLLTIALVVNIVTLFIG